jgi:hypothetical protein
VFLLFFQNFWGGIFNKKKNPKKKFGGAVAPPRAPPPLDPPLPRNQRKKFKKVPFRNPYFGKFFSGSFGT